MGRLGIAALIALAGCGRREFDAMDATIDGGETVGIQAGVLQLPTGMTAASVPLQLVDPTHAIVVFSVSVAAISPAIGFVAATLTSANVQFSRTASDIPATIAWQVIEAPDLFDVQHGEALSLGAGIGDQSVAIAPVDPTRSFVITSTRNTGAEFDEDDYAQVSLIDSTTLGFHIVVPSARLPTMIAYQVVSLHDGVAQGGAVSLPTSTSSTSAGLSAVDLTRSVPWISWAMGADIGDVGSVALRPTLDVDTLTITRGVATVPEEVTWTVISSPSFSVQHGTTTFVADEVSKSVPLDTFDPTRTFVVVTGAATPYAGIDPNDRMGIALFAAELQGSSLVLTRADGGDTASVSWAVVSLGTP